MCALTSLCSRGWTLRGGQISLAAALVAFSEFISVFWGFRGTNNYNQLNAESALCTKGKYGNYQNTVSVFYPSPEALSERNEQRLRLISGSSFKSLCEFSLYCAVCADLPCLHLQEKRGGEHFLIFPHLWWVFMVLWKNTDFLNMTRNKTMCMSVLLGV